MVKEGHNFKQFALAFSDCGGGDVGALVLLLDAIESIEIASSLFEDSVLVDQLLAVQSVLRDPSVPGGVEARPHDQKFRDTLADALVNDAGHFPVFIRFRIRRCFLRFSTGFTLRGVVGTAGCFNIRRTTNSGS